MKIRIFLCAMLAFTMLLPASVLSQERQRGGSGGMREKMTQLELTPEQETKLRELHRQNAPARREQNRKINEVREKINAELIKDKPSIRVLDDYAAQMGNLHRQMNVFSIDHMLKVKAILTPEQFKMFTEMAPMGDPSAHSRTPRGEDAPGGEVRTRENRGKDSDLENLENLMRRQRDNINR